VKAKRKGEMRECGYDRREKGVSESASIYIEESV